MAVVFDIETELFSKQFKEARGRRGRVVAAPKYLVACAYDDVSGEFFHFTNKNIKGLFDLFDETDEIVTFNGEHFDFVVLEKNFSYKLSASNRLKHSDLLVKIIKYGVGRPSLHELAEINLNEHKRVIRNSMAELKKSCKSDVEQTYILWRTFQLGNLVLPTVSSKRFLKSAYDMENFPMRKEILTKHLVNQLLPQSQLACITCNAFTAHLKQSVDDEDYSEMTDGQQLLSDLGFDEHYECSQCGNIQELDYSVGPQVISEMSMGEASNKVDELLKRGSETKQWSKGKKIKKKQVAN